VSTPPGHNLAKWRRRHYKKTKIKMQKFRSHSVAPEITEEPIKQKSNRKL